MIADVPPKLFKPAIIRPGEPWQREAHKKLEALGIPFGVRLAVVSELFRLQGDRPSVIRPALCDLQKYAGIESASILPGIGGFIAASSAAAAMSSSYVTETTANFINASSNTFSNISMGTADPARYILVAVFGRSNGNGAQTISSVTVGGNGATILVQCTPVLESSSSYNVVGFAIIALPTGTTANVVVTCSGSMYGFGIGVWRLINPSSATPTATATDTGHNPLTGSINVSAGGSCFGAAMTVGGGPSFTWSGLTERFDDSQNMGAVTGASNDFASGQTPLSISATPTVASGTAAAFAAFR